LFRFLILSVLAAVLASCGGGSSNSPASPPPPAAEVDIRLSAATAFAWTDPDVVSFLAAPQQAYVQAYFRFPADLAPDVWFGIDLELFEGVDQPLTLEGADWMGFFALTRDGDLGTPVGSAASHGGEPDDAETWDIQNLGVTFSPDTWYLIRGDVDFATRTFTSVNVSGPGIDVTVDLTPNLLSYPNYLPFDKPSLTFYVFSLRTKAAKQPGSTVVYFDDVGAGIQAQTGFQTVFDDGFEQQSDIGDVPITLPIIPMADITELLWYKEQDGAILSLSNNTQRTGNFSVACDASLLVQP
jgi:hypothetical protein